MRRREFLIGSAGAIAGFVAGRWGDGVFSRLATVGLPAQAREVLDLDTWIESLHGVGGVGARHLELLGEAAPDSQVLTRTLATRLRLKTAESMKAARLEQRIRAAIEADYREGRICSVDGWQLSQTECDIAGVYYQRHGLREREAPAPPGEGHIVTVQDWGPKSTEVGQPFNVQRDGHSGLWFRAAGAPAWLQVFVDGDSMPTRVTAAAVTSGLYGKTQERVLARPGRYAIVLYDKMARIRQTVGHLEVRPASGRPRLADGRESTAFCAIENWGPRETRTGVAVNQQPDGSIGIWIRTSCSAPAALVRAGDAELETRVHASRVTARLPLAMVERPGTLELSLHDPVSGESVSVGSFVVVR